MVRVVRPMTLDDKPEPSISESSKQTVAKVAVVDDEPEVRSTFSRLIAFLGYGTAALFENGDSFCDAVAKNHRSFDLVLMDYRMPGMNGIEAAKIVRECSPDTKIILVTGYDSVKEEAAAEGLMYLQKPFSTKALREAIKEALGGTSTKPLAHAEVPDMKQKDRPNNRTEENC